jgi:hypothetical protein
VTANILYAQSSLKLDSTINFIKEKGIKLNTVTPPPGFNVYYNCDSLLFMKGTFGDTIKIWTSSMDWYQDLEEFKDILKNERFGVTQFVKSIDNEGRIFVSSYHQTEFISRNDSLFEIGNSNPTPSEPLSKLFSDVLTQKIDKETYKTRLDSLHQIEERQAVYTPKLIFTKKMFQKSKKIKLTKKMNFQGDTIELERQWVENGKTCYLVRINNKEDGQETSYAYAINQDMKFVFWEGCGGH